MKQSDHLCERDRNWVIEMVVDWETGRGRHPSGYHAWFKKAWIDGALNDRDVAALRSDRKAALDPEAPF